MLGLRTALLPLLACAGLFVASASGDTLYAVLSGTSDVFGILDPITGVFTPLGTSPNVFGMGFAPNGTMYATDSANPAGVYQVDPLTGNLTNLGSSTSTTTGSTVGSNGLVYAVNSDSSAIFYTIDPTTLVVNVISSGLGFSSDGLAVFANGTFYTDAIISGVDTLEAVDPVSGIATQIGSGFGVQIFAGANMNGTIYGGAADGNLYTIDLTTGLATLDVAITGGSGNLDALASVPEPSTAMLAGAGIALIGLVFAVRRRRTKSSPL
jgi:hypothetical protein